MSTTFLALQCVECSTMQVKQQKKSSNKWVCAVCNQRQSLRQIHARGPQAKDLRKFVQAFNMSRASSDLPRSPIPSQTNHLSNSPEPPKKRTDWSEYLDPKETGEEDEDHEHTGISPIPVAVPPKKPTIELLQEKLALPKRPPSASAAPAVSRKRQEYQPRGPTEKFQRTAVRPVAGSSKWSEYLDGDEGFDGEGTGSSPPASGMWDGPRGGELRVEEEVHPDFI